MTNCKCELAGWCETHRRKMSEVRFRECKEKDGYFEVFQKDLLRRQDTSVGLGDVIDAVTTATGIKRVVRAVFGEDCGCDARKEALNKIRIT